MNNEINDDECHFSYSYNVKAAMEEYAVKSDFFSFGKSAKKTFYYKSLLLSSLRCRSLFNGWQQVFTHIFVKQ